MRRAEPEDAAVLASLVLAASEGLAEAAWRAMAAPGEEPLAVGRRRQAEKALTDEIWVIEKDGAVVAELLGYPIGPAPDGPDDDTPSLFRPLVELEALAPSTWYVNVLAVLPEHRGQGLGSELLQLAEHRALAQHLPALSLIVSDANGGARGLYERFGFAETARRAMVKEGWNGHGHDWVLMVWTL